MTARRDRPGEPATPAPNAATTREAKGSVQEAIGKLIGDDVVQAQGTAERKAGAADAAADNRKSSRS
jgi:uncharacterized protein YjbJ (UPF0337 family)